MVVNVWQRLHLQPRRTRGIGQPAIHFRRMDEQLGYFLMRHSQISTGSGCP
jgi:hypothetical protein